MLKTGITPALCDIAGPIDQTTWLPYSRLICVDPFFEGGSKADSKTTVDCSHWLVVDNMLSPFCMFFLEALNLIRDGCVAA